MMHIITHFDFDGIRQGVFVLDVIRQAGKSVISYRLSARINMKKTRTDEKK